MYEIGLIDLSKRYRQVIISLNPIYIETSTRQSSNQKSEGLQVQSLNMIVNLVRDELIQYFTIKNGVDKYSLIIII